MERMFNPFFTTEEAGRNTGLGLSLTYDAALERAGNIEAESELGQRTEMRVIPPKRSGRQQEALAVAQTERCSQSLLLSGRAPFPNGFSILAWLAFRPSTSSGRTVIVTTTKWNRR